jgi:hypothetical protein
MLSFILEPIHARQVTSLCLVLSLDNVYKSSKAYKRYYSFLVIALRPDYEAYLRGGWSHYADT